MIVASTPTGLSVCIPASSDEDFAYFRLEQADEIRRYYEENGYVVIRDLIPQALCKKAQRIFSEEVKPFKGFIYRQASANPERHVFTSHGYMLNSILNVQSMDARHFPRFRAAGLEVITHERLQQAVHHLFGEPGKLVQSMYFDGNPSTWPHQDTYYLDAEQIGRMSAAWIAIEDIAPGAGRFFVYPKSHLLTLPKNSGEQSIAFSHERYKQHVVDTIAKHRLECRAPALNEGDVLLWASRTIHGSLKTTQPERSRASFTSHFIPQSSRFLQWQTRIKGLTLETINGLSVHKPKDLSNRMNRAIFWIETTFPRAFQVTKKIAAKALTR
jgi:phytanoyl-CoA hydroxylase